MGKTISSILTTGITLTPSYDPLTITSQGAILGGNDAIYGGHAQAWQIANAGLLEASGPAVVLLGSGSTVTNTGTITDSNTVAEAIRINSGQGTVTNSGNIIGGFDGVVLTAGGTVTNSSGTIAGTGNVGIYISGGAATVTNAGTMSGSAASVQFSGTFADRLIVDPGAVFHGMAVGGSGSNTLELASGTSSATGTLDTNLGSAFSNFKSIEIDAGAKWQFAAGNYASPGVDLTDAGTLANAGVIEAAVTMAAGSSLGNAGLISQLGENGLEGTAVKAASGGVVITNTGSIAGLSGIVLRQGGTVINSGTVTGFGVGVDISGGNGTVTNAGILYSEVGYSLAFAGNYTDRLIVDPGAVFVGDVIGGSGTNTLELAAGTTSATGTINQLGSSIVGFGTVTVDAGAHWVSAAADTVASGEVLTDAGIFTNDGVIDTTVGVEAGGTLTNAAGATISTSGVGSEGVLASGVADLISNAGSIAGTRDGIALFAGGTVTNLAGGRISGNFGVYGGGPANVTNAGSIAGVHDGIELFAGGSIVNLAGGVISGGGEGIYIGGGAGTITNAGTITGVVQFEGSYNDRVVLDPGGVFSGNVIGGSGTNTLELAAGTGTIAAFTASFPNFDAIDADGGANWTVDLSSGESLANPAGDVFTLAAETGATVSLSGVGGDVFSNAGSVSVAGAGTADINLSFVNSGLVSQGAGKLAFLGPVTNVGTMALNAGAMSFGSSITGRGTVKLAAGTTLTLADGAAAGQTVNFSGAGTLDLGAPLDFHARITDFAKGCAVDLLSSAATTLSFANGTLTVDKGTTLVANLDFGKSYALSDFSLGSDGHGGALITFK
jgi:hypothetical protein